MGSHHSHKLSLYYLSHQINMSKMKLCLHEEEIKFWVLTNSKGTFMLKTFYLARKKNTEWIFTVYALQTLWHNCTVHLRWIVILWESTIDRNTSPLSCVSFYCSSSWIFCGMQMALCCWKGLWNNRAQKLNALDMDFQCREDRRNWLLVDLLLVYSASAGWCALPHRRWQEDGCNVWGQKRWSHVPVSFLYAKKPPIIFKSNQKHDRHLCISK